MGYVERVLQPDETVIATTRIHWWFVWRRTVMLLVPAAAVAAYALSQSRGARTELIAGAGLVAALALLLAVGPAIARATTELAVTNRRIILKRGFIQRHTIEMNRTQVESVDVDQGLLGRMLNFGDIVVHGTGADVEPFRCVANPLRSAAPSPPGDLGRSGSRSSRREAAQGSLQPAEVYRHAGRADHLRTRSSDLLR